MARRIAFLQLPFPLLLHYTFAVIASTRHIFEAGIGAALLSRTTIDDRDMGSTFQFENRLGVGVKRGDFDLHVRYMHYSNAGLSWPNNGIDLFIGGLSYKF
jgi:lipid A 3-O-deacylase